MKIKKILLPVDDSLYSVRAAEQAAELADQTGASVLVLHCYKPVPKYLGEPNFQHVLDRINQDNEELLAPYVHLFQGVGADFETRTLAGDVAEAVCETARLEKFDMIILGSKGKSDLEGLFLGSVTHKVLHIAPCPVLVVRGA